MDVTEKGKGSIVKTKEISPPSRPYLSGNAVGLKFQDNGKSSLSLVKIYADMDTQDIEDVFQKEVPLGNIPTNMALRW